MVTSSWIFLAVVLLGVWIIFDPLGDTESAALHESAVRLWKKRFQMLCCCIGRDEQSENAFSDVAAVLSSFFKDIDLVPSDIAAGLVLLHAKQKKDQMSRATHELQPATDLQDCAANVELPTEVWMNIDYATHYMRYALAVYGWPMFFYNNLCTGICQIHKHMACCCYGQIQHEMILNDNCLHCHSAALKRQTGLCDDDIIFVNFHNKVYEIPFFVCLDHQTRSIVIAIRGTLSLRDALTDLSAEQETFCTNIDEFSTDSHHTQGGNVTSQPVALTAATHTPPPSLIEMPETNLISDENSDLSTVCAHKGMLNASKYILETLDEHDVLGMAFQLQSQYSLVLTGHSLGAGAAALLSLLLKRRYPNIRCFAFSPPGGLLRCEPNMQAHIVSVVLGADLVPRLGLSQMENLREELINIINNTRRSKHQIMLRGLWNLCFGSRRQADDDREPLLEGRTVQAARYVADSDTRVEMSQSANQPLAMPGKILYICESERSRHYAGVGWFSSGPSYTASWCRADKFNHVIIHPRMLSDHMPDAVLRALQQLQARNKEIEQATVDLP